jgi:hypothetical protein
MEPMPIAYPWLWKIAQTSILAIRRHRQEGTAPCSGRHSYLKTSPSHDEVRGALPHGHCSGAASWAT